MTCIFHKYDEIKAYGMSEVCSTHQNEINMVASLMKELNLKDLDTDRKIRLKWNLQEEGSGQGSLSQDGESEMLMLVLQYTFRLMLMLQYTFRLMLVLQYTFRLMLVL
jgi:hypothetical protein